MQAKEKGNAAFKAGDFATAVGHYTAAFLADPSNPTFPLNRAAAYLKLGKYEDAVRDCSTVLKLDPTNLKAWFRSGQARVSLGAFEDARTDFAQVLQLDGKNAAAATELSKIEGLLNAAKRPKTTLRDVTIPSSSKPPPKRRRVPIMIVEPSSSTSGDHPPTIPDHPPAKLRCDTKADTESSSMTFQNAKIAREVQQTRVGGGIFRANGHHTVFNTTSRSPPVPSEPTHPVEPVAVTNATSDEVSSSPAAAQGSSCGLHVPKQDALKPTMALFDFTRRWDGLQSVAERWNLLADNIPPSCLPILFKTTLESRLLVSMLSVFDNVLRDSPSAGMPAAIQAYMESMSRVPRFSTVVLFMSEDEKKLVKAIWEALGSDKVEGMVLQAKIAWRIS